MKNALDFGRPALALPRAYLEALERARDPGASDNERRLAHIVDALLVALICSNQARGASEAAGPIA